MGAPLFRETTICEAELGGSNPQENYHAKVGACKVGSRSSYMLLQPSCKGYAALWVQVAPVQGAQLRAGSPESQNRVANQDEFKD